MSQVSMASFSDAHECEEIPIIAANLHRMIHPAQSQIWAVIRQDDTLERIVYVIANTFLGRMCISGDVTHLTQMQWEILEKGIVFYRKITPIIKNGQSFRYGTKGKGMRHLKGWQALLRMGDDQKAYIVIHIFSCDRFPMQIEIKLPKDCPQKVLDIYSECHENVEVEDDCLYYKATREKKALAILLGT